MGNTSPLLDVDVVCSSTYVVGLNYQSLFVSVSIVVVEVIQASEESVTVKKHIRQCVFLSVFVLLVACGGGQSAMEEDVTTVTAVTTDDVRIVTHPFGETEVPLMPQRIVSLGAEITDSLIALGITPVGVTTYTGDNFESFEYLDDALQDVTIVGSFVEPNQEAILQLDPDLIIGWPNQIHGDVYPTLSQIAPMVAMGNTIDFREGLWQVAVIVGREAEAEAHITAYEEQAAEIGAEIQAVIGDETVAFLRIQPHSTRIYSNQHLGGPILYHDLGIAQPTFVEAIVDDTPYIEISLEELPQLAAADHIFLVDESIDDDPSPMFSSPLWERLPAVQNGQVYPVTRDIWISQGFLAAKHVVETVEQSLVDETSSKLADISGM